MGWRIFVKPEGADEFIKFPKLHFKYKSRATTYAGIETVAGMGELYEARYIKKRK